VPLAGPEGVMHGVLAVYGRRPRRWSDHEIQALSALAGNASAALANAELYQRVALEKERSMAILANIADGIVAVDRDEKVVLWNDAAQRITGVSAADALGRTLREALRRDLQPPEDADDGHLIRIQRQGSSEELWLSVTEAVMRDPAGSVAGRIFAFRDVSTDRLVEQVKSDFVSTVSHELRTPLTSIYGFAETLLRQDVPFGEDERRTFLSYISSESARLTNIVDALLNVARLDTGDLNVRLAPTDVGEVVDDVVRAAVEAEPNARRITVELPDRPLTAAADADKLRQVLANLVDNALKFSPTDRAVTVAADLSGEYVQVRVRDEGMGIPEHEHERIFRKFSRVEADGQPVEQGTGLGLFIAQGLMRAMGGRIWLDPVEGEGSCFAFELRAADREAAPGATERGAERV
jgi:two-component system phosphate regulon sensor histidine kinase PhoR